VVEGAADTPDEQEWQGDRQERVTGDPAAKAENPKDGDGDE
jgi:hypothetical protein